MQVCLPLRKTIRKSSSERLSESVVESLEGNVNVFSPICVLDIGIAEDVGTSHCYKYRPIYRYIGRDADILSTTI